MDQIEADRHPPVIDADDALTYDNENGNQAVKARHDGTRSEPDQGLGPDEAIDSAMSEAKASSSNESSALAPIAGGETTSIGDMVEPVPEDVHHDESATIGTIIRADNLRDVEQGPRLATSDDISLGPSSDARKEASEAQSIARTDDSDAYSPHDAGLSHNLEQTIPDVPPPLDDRDEHAAQPHHPTTPKVSFAETVTVAGADGGVARETIADESRNQLDDVHDAHAANSDVDDIVDPGHSNELSLKTSDVIYQPAEVRRSESATTLETTTQADHEDEDTQALDAARQATQRGDLIPGAEDAPSYSVDVDAEKDSTGAVQSALLAHTDDGVQPATTNLTQAADKGDDVTEPSNPSTKDSASTAKDIAINANAETSASHDEGMKSVSEEAKQAPGLKEEKLNDVVKEGTNALRVHGEAGVLAPEAFDAARDDNAAHQSQIQEALKENAEHVSLQGAADISAPGQRLTSEPDTVTHDASVGNAESSTSAIETSEHSSAEKDATELKPPPDDSSSLQIPAADEVTSNGKGTSSTAADAVAGAEPTSAQERSNIEATSLNEPIPAPISLPEEERVPGVDGSASGASSSKGPAKEGKDGAESGLAEQKTDDLHDKPTVAQAEKQGNMEGGSVAQGGTQVETAKSPLGKSVLKVDTVMSRRIALTLKINKELIRLCVDLQSKNLTNDPIFKDAAVRLQSNLAFLAGHVEPQRMTGNTAAALNDAPFPKTSHAPDSLLPRLYDHLRSIEQGEKDETVIGRKRQREDSNDASNTAKSVGPGSPASSVKSVAQPGPATPSTPKTPATAAPSTGQASAPATNSSPASVKAPNGRKKSTASTSSPQTKATARSRVVTPASSSSDAKVVKSSSGTKAGANAPQAAAKALPSAAPASNVQQTPSIQAPQQQQQANGPGPSPQQLQSLIQTFGQNAVTNLNALQAHYRHGQPQQIVSFMENSIQGFRSMPIQVQMQHMTNAQNAAMQRQRQTSAGSVGSPAPLSQSMSRRASAAQQQQQQQQSSARNTASPMANPGTPASTGSTMGSSAMPFGGMASPSGLPPQSPAGFGVPQPNNMGARPGTPSSMQPMQQQQPFMQQAMQLPPHLRQAAMASAAQYQNKMQPNAQMLPQQQQQQHPSQQQDQGRVPIDLTAQFPMLAGMPPSTQQQLLQQLLLQQQQQQLRQQQQDQQGQQGQMQMQMPMSMLQQPQQQSQMGPPGFNPMSQFFGAGSGNANGQQQQPQMNSMQSTGGMSFPAGFDPNMGGFGAMNNNSSKGQGTDGNNADAFNNAFHAGATSNFPNAMWGGQ